MRGSIYYQSSILTKLIFKEGTKKEEKVDFNNDLYQYVSSYKTMESYRKIWNNLGLYVYDIYGIKDFEKISKEHIEKYMYEKIFSDVSHKYLQKVSSAIGKLEVVLNKFSNLYSRGNIYDFSIRLKIQKEVKKLELTQNNYRDRSYTEPTKVIKLLQSEELQIAANIQLFGGARSEGVTQIRKEQLQGYKIDTITNTKVGVIITKEKGGKTGEIFMHVDTYEKLKRIINNKGIYKINYNKYADAIRNACRVLDYKPEGTHGLRWNFAQKRMREYQGSGYSYQDSLQLVSYEMKHMRADITSHYTG